MTACSLVSLRASAGCVTFRPREHWADPLGRSLSLAAYRILSWRGDARALGTAPTRPEGTLLWVHATSQKRFRIVADICRRLVAQRPDLFVLFTVPSDTEIANWGDGTTMMVALPSDHPAQVSQFLEHWKPDLCLWSGGDLHPNLISETSATQIPLILMDLTADELTLRRHQWVPDLLRTTLDCFDAILANGEQAARLVRRTGILSRKVSVSAELRANPTIPGWPEEELSETTTMLAGRPVWLSAWSSDNEFISIIVAHRSAMRLLHRLVLVLHVADPAEAPALRSRLEASDLRCANWDHGDEIEDNTQVVITSIPDDLGLWYRIAPVTFMAGSLESGSGGHDPLMAAALGSALLFGPNVGQHLDTYAELELAGAARRVRDARTLGAAVVDLLAPDVAAAMALSGWQFVTEGAHLTDQLIDLIQDHLDEGEMSHARP